MSSLAQRCRDAAAKVQAEKDRVDKIISSPKETGGYLAKALWDFVSRDILAEYEKDNGEAELRFKLLAELNRYLNADAVYKAAVHKTARQEWEHILDVTGAEIASIATNEGFPAYHYVVKHNSDRGVGFQNVVFVRIGLPRAKYILSADEKAKNKADDKKEKDETS